MTRTQKTSNSPLTNTWSVPDSIVEARYSECELNNGVSNTGGFCLTAKKQGRYKGADEVLANFLADEIFSGRTVVDLGAGLGGYGKKILEEGRSVKGWVGYDGALDVHKATDDWVRFMDLTQPDASDERPCAAGDWVLSLEVGEHIPRQFMDSYLRNIRCHALVGAVVSWAIPKQGGFHHVNNLPEEDVHLAMGRWGFKVDHGLTEKARSSSKFPWFKNTISVYRIKTDDVSSLHLKYDKGSFDQAHSIPWSVTESIVQHRYSECEKGGFTKTGGYCLTGEKLGRYKGADVMLATFLAEEVFSGQTVVDLGAGGGGYGKIFLEEGRSVKGWVGYDGALNVRNATKDWVQFMDLTQPDASDERPCVTGDWVLSLEVGEHIPPQFMDSYIRNIRCRARIGAVVSWAKLKQGGFHHVNNLQEEEVHSFMKKWGFVLDQHLTNRARSLSRFPWFKNNVSVYHVVQVEAP